MEIKKKQKFFVCESSRCIECQFLVGFISEPEVTTSTTIETTVLTTTFATDTVDITQRHATSATFTTGWLI
jgi:hypothetical protein